MHFLKRLSSRFHLALGMSALVVTLLLAALFAGLMPDRGSALRSGRTSLAEAVGVAAAALTGEEDSNKLKQVLDFVVSRNPELVSIGLRQTDGTLALQAGQQAHIFAVEPNARSTETHVRVPLLFEGEPWGHAELHFLPLEDSASISLYRGSPALLVMLVGFGCFVAFYLYLRRMLRHLDPSSVIPGRVRTAFDTLAEGVLVLDPRGRVVLANQAFVAVVGGTTEALVGRKAADLGWTQPPGASPTLTPWHALLTDGQARRDVLLYLTGQDGKRRSYMANGSPVPGPDGKPAGMLVSLDDVTALHEQEEQLRLARDSAEAANRAKSDFLANMSHEIRTPMNAILGFAELLRRGWQQNPHDTQRHLDTILGSGKHLLALINDILDLSKVEAGRLEVEAVPCKVHEVVHEVLDIMRARADQSGVQLRLDFPQAMPASLNTDPARLRQIVTNLVGNALKFTAQGSVSVRVYLGPEVEKARLHIDVADTGIGIPSNKLEAIFEPFVQAEVSTTRQFGGTGLGLTISRRFARALGGDIVATSVPGQGSTFHVSLGASLGANMGAIDVQWLTPQQLCERQTTASENERDLRWQFEPATVLVVDDGVENRELVRLVLESVGLTVVEAQDGSVALSQVAATQPALVLMDVQMPVMDGYTATRRLRDQGFAAPVLALTANAMKGFEAQIEAAGFTGYLTKPVNIDGLLQTLAGHLRAQQVRAPAALPVSEAPVVARAPVAAASTPIRSRLESHPRLARVARKFALGLPAKLAQMQRALASNRLQELAQLAHWLKGAGGTVGFDQFFDPARRFEQHVRNQDVQAMQDGLQELQSLAARIVAPGAEHDPAGGHKLPVLEQTVG
jgi:PAS domain S-box-containing protein